MVIFDAATVKDQATFTEPHQYPLGIETVLVNGTVSVDRRKATGARAGRVMKAVLPMKKIDLATLTGA